MPWWGRLAECPGGTPPPLRPQPHSSAVQAPVESPTGKFLLEIKPVVPVGQLNPGVLNTTLKNPAGIRNGILGCGMSSSSPLATRGPLLARLCTQVDLCLGCPRCAQRLNESTYILCEVEHSCSREILLACFKGAAKKVWREVGHRPRFPRPWRYKVCRYYNPGLGCQHHWNRCTFARSPEEALVWTFELKHSLSRLWLKAAVQGDAAQDRRCGAADAILAEFGGHFQLLCAHCFRAHPQRLHPVNPQGQCSEHRTCPALLVHVSTQGRKRQFVEVRPKPQSGRPLRYCRFVGRGQPCRHGATRCQFAHSAVEMAVWEAEQLGGLQREVLCTVPTLQRDKGLAPNSQSPGGSQPPEVELYCRTCLLTYRSQEAFESHCASLEHSLTLAFDQATPWEHRAPPLGLSKFELCPRPDLCEYGAICTKAHSEQELQEWIQRAEAAELCEQAAWKDGLVPYRAWLLAEYQRSSCEALVMAETVCGVSITCHQPLVHQAQEKKIQHSWAFSVHSEDPLLHVALLKQEPGADFSLVAPCLPSGWLYASGERFRVPSSRAEFQVGVRVQTTSFGTFEQWVVFDFGRRPVLLRKLRLQLGQALCSELGGRGGRPAPGRPEEVDVWHTGNRHVVPCVERTAEQAALMTKYKVPTLGLKVSPSSLASEPISQANYRQNMHHFLYEEEAARRQLVAKLTLRGRVSLKTSLQTPALGMLFAPPGSLYAKVLVPSALTPDTAQGFLLGREVSTALVAPMPAPDNTVFEVWLEKRASLEQALWLLLPKHCCVALGLQAEGSPILEVQFQIDPLNFWFWHQAVDALPEERLVVPDLPSCALPCPRPIPPSLPGNHKQKLAVGLIAGSSTGSTKPVPPLLIYGPFGTGKTYTLAMATLEVIRQPHAKVLICTHTNSAADIYIREYFHGHVTRGHFEATPLRVMYTDRPPNQTDPTTLQYCCLTKDARAFRPPTQAELVRHCVVVTTTSQARELRVPTGFFSHILIDEAAQMLECEALTPLAYASPCTHVVLAGDHLQVTPRLFSVPRAKAAGHTLLYRLFLHYQQEAHQIAKQSRIIFLENYRSTAAIIGFISRHFYLAKGNPIQASGKVPPHPRQYPLMFCHVAGTPEQDMSMTSWLNPAEVTQVVEKVQEVYNTWPYCWGVREQRSICAVSHGTQVSALRQELRRRNLGEVSVGSFETLPGREFRVVVLSTVHNRHSLISCGAPTLEFFTDARVLNTVMTRAQSQLVAVGDAMALCSFGACSKLWKSFIRECVEHNSIFPEGLSLGQIEQGVAERQHWASVALRAERTWASVVRGTSLDRAAGSPATEHTAVAKVLPGPVTTKSEATKHACAQSYQRRALSLRLATQLKVQPRDKLGFVVDVEPGTRCFKLLFPASRETLPDPCPVHFHSLQLAEHPHDLESRRGLQLVWRRRIYSVQESKQRTPPPGTLTDPHVCTIDTTLWQRLLVLVQQERWPEAATLIQKHSGKGCQRRKLVQVNRSPCGHFLEVARELGSGDTLQVQVSASTQRGFLVPTLQLWTVAPGLSLCLEHAEHPVSCFSGHAQQASKERYCDEDEYSLIWGPLCSQESASNAVAENESIVLQHVCISWDAERTQQGQLQGAFHLDPAFLQENCTDVDFSCCYLCIRLEGLPVPPAHPASGPSSLGPLLSIDPDTYTWVAHGRVDSRDQEDQVDCQEAPRGVHFFIYHMAMEKVPENVLRPGTLFTVEVVLRQLPDLITCSRKEQAVRRLKKASPLVISIALGRPLLQPRVPSHQRPFCRGTATRLLKQQAYDIPGAHPKLNASQNRAIRQALEKPFTLIQGPPGTGKTFVGLHIIFWFHKSNLEQVPIRRSPDGGEPLEGPCVLYCGPSNKSVDVLAGMLLSWRAELRPLRVYGEQCEATEFPVPGMGSRGLCNKNPREGRPGQALRNISLHHRIRRAPNPHAPKVREFDARVSRGEVFSKADLTVYRRVMWEARKFELARHSVILCTCCCAASHCLQTLKVQQILIDEASMTTEPETLIPLVHFSGAKKVVLLGDHKQLRPVVKNEHLRNLGMDKSLFERYHRDAHVLDTQYRMHEVICAFPSAEFYGGKLKTWQGLRRPPSILGHAGKESCPVIFGHVQGHEQRLLVTTEDGNENSRANPEEVAEVIRITKQLTLDRKVDPKDIAILTPYNAQAAAINKGLMREGVTGVTVSSITKSQGSEWRYVLVSTVCTCPKSDVDHWPTRSWLRKFLGFVVDPNQVNVAITRAQEGLCLIGDHILLSCCPLWRRLIDFCKAQQSFVPANKVRVWRRPAVSL
ncbi:Peroxisomal proliferator-activated receptor A-interacting complex 285 kDa protein [Fukomys damarensis]|uniref:3'-5' exoribonuclease HELZ2 n=1 Tax=Fukomys damarensis TaxID=885580 RepID=A0A091E4J5_FUKDA|nr:Peroxisomal proliferator-activated receptor A-interacting complex 285 kDa protein [Fukomys damarensis]